MIDDNTQEMLESIKTHNKTHDNFYLFFYSGKENLNRINTLINKRNSLRNRLLEVMDENHPDFNKNYSLALERYNKEIKRVDNKLFEECNFEINIDAKDETELYNTINNKIFDTKKEGYDILPSSFKLIKVTIDKVDKPIKISKISY